MSPGNRDQRATPGNHLNIVLVSGARAGAKILERVAPGNRLICLEAHSPDLIDALRDADAVVTDQLTANELESVKDLRLVQVLGAGYDSIAANALPTDCVLCNVREHETAIAEWVLMGMLALSRRLLSYDDGLRRGDWGTGYRFEGTPEQDLRGRTVGVIALGAIGSEVANLAQAIGMRTIAVTRTPERGRRSAGGLDWVRPLSDLSDLMRESDFAVVCAPETSDTRNLIGPNELDTLGPQGYLLNVARGPIVQEAALYEALRSEAIAGAAIDVWYRYPASQNESCLPAEFPFWELDNVLMTPHIAGFTSSTFEGRWKFIADQMTRLANGEELCNVV